MKSDEPRRDADSTEDPQLVALRRELDRLPGPPIPRGLEARLVAAIPAKITARPLRVESTSRRWVYASAAAAAVLLLALTPWLRSRDAKLAELSDNSNTVLSPASPAGRGSDPKETDPCNVLPPWPDWR